MSDVLLVLGVLALFASLLVRHRSERAVRPLLYGGAVLVAASLVWALTVERDETLEAYRAGYESGGAVYAPVSQ